MFFPTYKIDHLFNETGITLVTKTRLATIAQ
jgi:hypothetical protein